MLVLKPRAKKYLCDFDGCPKAYTRPSLLEQHRRTHLNQRNFICSECSKSFLRKSHLKVHQWTHSDVKPLTCPYCRKGFTTSQQLSRHMNTHPPEKACPYGCGLSFPADADIYTHILENHLMNDIFQPSEMKDHPEAKHSPFAEQYKTAPAVTHTAEGKSGNSVPIHNFIPSAPSHSTLIEHSTGQGATQMDLPTNLGHSPVSTLFSSEFDGKSSQSATSVASTGDGNAQTSPEWLHLHEVLDHHTLKCLESICLEYPDYDSTFDLIQHYDTFHHFIPLSLFPTYTHIHPTDDQSLN